ncbi:hypothetical protein LTR95_008285 [Oleoguttula sp. CCFEE 5521]
MEGECAYDSVTLSPSSPADHNWAGDTCGSSWTNELAYKHFCEVKAESPLHRDRREETCRTLGIPESDMRRQFFRCFDDEKIKFNQKASRFNIIIEGLQGMDLDTMLRFDKTLMTDWFDRWADDNGPRGPVCGMAVLTGGGAKSRHLHRRLKDFLADNGI